MAENDEYNDEYQFADLDAIGPEDSEDIQLTDNGQKPTETIIENSDKNNIKRNAAIALAIIFVAMILYKIMESLFSNKAPVKTVVPTLVTPAAVEPIPQVVAPAPVVVAPAPDSDKINQRLSAVEIAQSNLRSDLSTVNNQLTGISSNVNTMLAKMAELNGVIASLEAKVDVQARELEQLAIHREAKKIHHVTRKPVHYPRYYIQAVIPGRAWLIAANGATLTVREGTPIAGYGKVKLIDPAQGRVTTTSGQVIKFSQEDS